MALKPRQLSSSAWNLQVMIWFKNLMKLGSIIFITVVSSLDGSVSLRMAAACKCCQRYKLVPQLQRYMTNHGVGCWAVQPAHILHAAAQR